jgi:hypothetical protein
MNGIISDVRRNWTAKKAASKNEQEEELVGPVENRDPGGFRRRWATRSLGVVHSAAPRVAHPA